MPEFVTKKWKSSEFIHDYNFFMYNLTGFGILENSKNWKKRLYFIYHNIFHSIYCFFIASFIVDAYLVRNDKEKLFLNLCVTIVTTGSLVKMWSLMGKLENIVELRRKFRENFNLLHVGKEEAHKEILEKHSCQQVLITKTLTSLAIPLVTIWITFPLVDPTTKEWKYCLPFPLLKNEGTPIFEIMYAIQAFILVHFVSNIMHNDLLIIGSLVRICGQFDILICNISKIKKIYPNLDFEKFVPDYENRKGENIEDYNGSYELRTKYNWNEWEIKSESSGKLKSKKYWQKMETLKLMQENIIHHRCILKQVEDINQIYGVQLFIQVTVGALVISVVAYDIIVQSRKFNAPVLQQLFYVAAVSTDIFLICFYGSQIEQKSEKVAEALYDIPWHEMDVSSRKICSFMIAKCRKSPKIKARFMFTMNLSTYQSLVKTSYNVIALLNNSQ